MIIVFKILEKNQIIDHKTHQFFTSFFIKPTNFKIFLKQLGFDSKKFFKKNYCDSEIFLKLKSPHNINFNLYTPITFGCNFYETFLLCKNYQIFICSNRYNTILLMFIYFDIIVLNMGGTQ